VVVAVAIVVEATWREEIFVADQKLKKRATSPEPRRQRAWWMGMKMMGSRKRRVERRMLKTQTPRV